MLWVWAVVTITATNLHSVPLLAALAEGLAQTNSLLAVHRVLEVLAARVRAHKALEVALEGEYIFEENFIACSQIEVVGHPCSSQRITIGLKYVAKIQPAFVTQIILQVDCITQLILRSPIPFNQPQRRRRRLCIRWRRGVSFILFSLL